MKVLSEKDIESIKNRDMKPLRLIFDANYLYCVQNLKRLFNCNDEDAKDMTMDAFLILVEKIKSGTYLNQNVRSFLLAVASNKWRNKYKVDKRVDSIDPSEFWFLATPLEPEDSEYFKSKVKEVINYIETLKNPCRTILNLLLIQGVSLDSVHDIMDYKTKGALKMTKYRCLDKLRQAIDFK